jgi:hypothetical protein
MALYDDVLRTMKLLPSFDPEMVTAHDLAPVFTEMSENDAERPGMIVKDKGGSAEIREFPFDPTVRQGSDYVEVEIFFPVTDSEPEVWEVARQIVQSEVLLALNALRVGRIQTELTWSGWHEVLLDGTATPSYTSTTFNLVERLW